MIQARKNLSFCTGATGRGVLNTLSEMAAEDSESSRRDVIDRILASARRNIEEHGILGLRVADVAEQAFSSVTQIYRYFGNRDGLLARVLGDIYEEYLDSGLEWVMENLSQQDPLTVEGIVASLPSPTDPRIRRNQEVRLQILAAAVNNEPLRERLEEITVRHHDEWNEALDYAISRLAPGTSFDRRVFMIGLTMQMGYYRTLMSEKGFSEEEYRRYLLDKLTN